MRAVTVLHGSAAFFLGLGLTTLFGCSGAQVRDAKAQVSLGEWCQQVSGKLCELTGSRCFGGIAGVADGCRNTAVPSCLAGRDPALPSGRQGADLDRCLAALAPLSCEQLGAGLGSGQLATFCSATAPSTLPASDGPAGAPASPPQP